MLSASTEAYDRGAKFEHYRNISGLMGYLLISQDRVLVELYTRQQDDRWLLTSASDKDRVISIDPIDCRLAVGELYLNVDLDPDRPTV